VADGRNPHVVQVIGRQFRQDLGVDRVVAKRLLVLLEAEAAQ
jgi:hypothetical protein